MSAARAVSYTRAKNVLRVRIHRSIAFAASKPASMHPNHNPHNPRPPDP